MAVTTTKSLRSALAILLAFCAVASAADLSDPKTIQAKLDADPGWMPQDRKEPGLYLTLAPKIIELSKPLKITSGQTIVGKAGATRLRFMGGPGTAAVLITSRFGHQYTKGVKLLDVDIECPNGADAVAIDPSAKWVEAFDYVGDTFNSRINLPGENYFCTITTEFHKPTGQMLRIDGQGNNLDIRIFRAGPVWKLAANVVETHGSVTIMPGSRLETDAPYPTLAAFDWQGWRGVVIFAGTVHVEPIRANVPPVLLDHVDFYGSALWGDWPRTGNSWKFINGATASLPAPTTQPTQPQN